MLDAVETQVAIGLSPTQCTCDFTSNLRVKVPSDVKRDWASGFSVGILQGPPQFSISWFHTLKTYPKGPKYLTIGYLGILY